MSARYALTVPTDGELQIEQSSRAILRDARLDSLEAWIKDSRIEVWRDIRERQNATIELAGTRFHVKRLRPPYGRQVTDEVAGIRLLEAAGIATVPLVAWGVADDGSGVLVTRDLAGFIPCDQRLARGEPFRPMLEPTAGIAGRLHAAGLHHRDLYLCHFLMNDAGEVRLIDAARVRKLPWLTRRRWLVKDLAQFRFSGAEAGVSATDLDAWLDQWAAAANTHARRWRVAVLRKAEAIARHDANLAKAHPERYASLGEGGRSSNHARVTP